MAVQSRQEDRQIIDMLARVVPQATRTRTSKSEVGASTSTCTSGLTVASSRAQPAPCGPVINT